MRSPIDGTEHPRAERPRAAHARALPDEAGGRERAESDEAGELARVAPKAAHARPASDAEDGQLPEDLDTTGKLDRAMPGAADEPAHLIPSPADDPAQEMPSPAGEPDQETPGAADEAAHAIPSAADEAAQAFPDAADVSPRTASGRDAGGFSEEYPEEVSEEELAALDGRMPLVPLVVVAASVVLVAAVCLALLLGQGGSAGDAASGASGGGASAGVLPASDGAGAEAGASGGAGAASGASGDAASGASAVVAGASSATNLFDASGNLLLATTLRLPGDELQDALERQGYAWADDASTWMALNGASFEVRGKRGALSQDRIGQLGAGGEGSAVVFTQMLVGYKSPEAALEGIAQGVKLDRTHTASSGDAAYARGRLEDGAEHLVAVVETGDRQQELLVYTEEAVAKGLFAEMSGVAAGKSIDKVWDLIALG